VTVPIPCIVYFLGPFLLAFFIGKRLLKVSYAAFGVGLLTFFVAWLCITLVSLIFSRMSESLNEGTLFYSLIVSTSAALFEESGRFFAFRFFKRLRNERNWNTGIMYAIGHSGSESIIVGANLLLAMIIVNYAPHLISPEILQESKAALQVGFPIQLYNSFERLFVGLLIHGCFTLVVLLGLIRSKGRYLFFAMLWHFGHDMVGFNLHHLSNHWIVGKLWVVSIVIVYSIILFKLKRATTQGSGSSLSFSKSVRFT
jgi:uncharacterized membrane protein YhfC